MALVFPLPLSCWGRGSPGRKRGTALCAWSLAPAQDRPEPGLALRLSWCAAFPSQSFCATLGRRDGWEGRVSSVLSALKKPQPWLCLAWAAAGTRGGCHGSPGPSVLCQQHLWGTKAMETARNGAKRQWGGLGGARASWHSAGGTEHGGSAPRNHSKASCASPVPGSGRTLRETVLESSPILALLNESFISTWSLVKELEELQVRLTLCWGARGCQGSSLLCQGDLCSEPSLCSGTAGARQKQMEQAQKWHCDPLALSWCQV